MNRDNKDILPIQTLDIRIDSESSVPHIILNGVDIKHNGVGLKALKIIWGSKEDEIPETLIQIDYLDGKDEVHEVSLKQSFPGSLLKKESTLLPIDSNIIQDIGSAIHDTLSNRKAFYERNF